MPELTLASLLAQAETPCTSGCVNGWIDNAPAVDAWQAEHAEQLRAFEIERRAYRRADMSYEEMVLKNTRPPLGMHCACDGAGGILTDDGRALIEFLGRHGVGGKR